MGGYGEAIAIVGVIAGIASAAVGTAAAISQAEQTQAARKDQARAMKSIEDQKLLDAEAARETAAFEERQDRRRLALLGAKQEAVFAASGYDTGSGTPLYTELDFAKQAELDALSVRRAGAQASGASTFEANIARFQRQRLSGGGTGLQTTAALIQGASGVASSAAGYYGTRSKLSRWYGADSI